MSTAKDTSAPVARSATVAGYPNIGSRLAAVGGAPGEAHGGPGKGVIPGAELASWDRGPYVRRVAPHIRNRVVMDRPPRRTIRRLLGAAGTLSLAVSGAAAV